MKKNLRIAACALFFFEINLFAQVTLSTSRFDSAHSVAVDATFDGVIESEGESDENIILDIQDQLFYTVGALNQHQGVGDIAQAVIQLVEKEPLQETGFARVKYRASLVVGWPREIAYPQKWSTAVPLRVTEPVKREFFQRYSKTCAVQDSDLISDTFYYYIRPEISGCELIKQSPSDISTRLDMTFSASAKMTEGKNPEYHKIWEDNSLSATLIFGNDQEVVEGDSDWGIYAAKDTYAGLISAFGNPSSSNLPIQPNQLPSNQHPYVEMSWNLDDGKTMNIALILIQAKLLAKASDEFRSKYAARTRNADYVSYNGHSGYGDNIRELARLGEFVKGQYQIFRVYGCDTYAYVSDAIAQKHLEVNPGYGRDKYLDMITAAYPGSFGDMASSNVSIIRSLKDAKENYREILSKIPALSRAIVTGEEDNRWPAPF